MSRVPVAHRRSTRRHSPTTGAATTMTQELDPDDLVERYLSVRALTERLARDLSPEDQCLQSMPPCSPTKWHRAHTSWFFETFLLAPAGIAPFDPSYAYLFNSYYEALGPRVARAHRGLLSRPTEAEIRAYRRAVDGRMIELLSSASAERRTSLRDLVELGLAHEQQHQELILTDVLNAFSLNPTEPALLTRPAPVRDAATSALRFVEFQGGLVQIGAADGGAFAFDNERPRHKRWLDPFALADRLVTVGEVRAFIDAGGYRTSTLWLSEGWDFAQRHGIEAPLYARAEGSALSVFGLSGRRVAGDGEPALHLSFYEADAIARFLGARLPTEAEWEHAARSRPVAGNFLDPDDLVPHAASSEAECLRQLWGDAWEWTRSAYEPYPGFSPAAGAVGEYNGKFMVGQLVLRGGSYLTPPGHVRATYRNFWHPDTRFQATGVRLARSIP